MLRHNLRSRCLKNILSARSLIIWIWILSRHGMRWGWVKKSLDSLGDSIYQIWQAGLPIYHLESEDAKGRLWFLVDTANPFEQRDSTPAPWTPKRSDSPSSPRAYPQTHTPSQDSSGTTVHTSKHPSHHQEATEQDRRFWSNFYLMVVSKPRSKVVWMPVWLIWAELRANIADLFLSEVAAFHSSFFIGETWPRDGFISLSWKWHRADFQNRPRKAKWISAFKF